MNKKNNYIIACFLRQIVQLDCDQAQRSVIREYNKSRMQHDLKNYHLLNTERTLRDKVKISFANSA